MYLKCEMCGKHNLEMEDYNPRSFIDKDGERRIKWKVKCKMCGKLQWYIQNITMVR